MSLSAASQRRRQTSSSSLQRSFTYGSCLTKLPASLLESIVEYVYEDAEALSLTSVARGFWESEGLAKVLTKRDSFTLRLVSPTLWTEAFCRQAILNSLCCEKCAMKLWKSIPYKYVLELRFALVATWPGLHEKVLPVRLRTKKVVQRILQIRKERDESCNFLLEHLDWFIDNERFMRAAISIDATHFRSASARLREDKALILLALEQPRGHLVARHVTPKLAGDDGFLRTAAAALGSRATGLAHLFAEPQLDLVEEALRKDPLGTYSRLSSRLRRVASVWRLALELEPLTIQHVHSEDLSYSDVSEAIRRKPKAFCLLSHSKWVSDRKLALLALSLQGTLLGNETFREEGWCCDEEAALTAVTQNGLAYEFVCDHMKNHEGILKAALKSNGLALAYAPLQARRSFPLVKLACEQTPHAFHFSEGLEDMGIPLLKGTVLEGRVDAPPLVPRSREDFFL